MLWCISWCFLQMKDFTSHESSLEGWSLVCYISIAITPNFTCKHHKKTKDMIGIAMRFLSPTRWTSPEPLPETAASETKKQTALTKPFLPGGNGDFFQHPHLLEHHRPGIALWPCRNQGRPVKVMLRKFPKNKHHFENTGIMSILSMVQKSGDHHLGWC